MKTLILYATKHGATRRIAQELQKELDDAQLADLGAGPAPDLKAAEQVIVGSSVYAGTLRKEAKDFLAANEAELLQKPLGLFVSGLDMGGAEGTLARNGPKALVDHAKAKAVLGGAFDPRTGGFFERLIMRLITKTSGPVDRVSSDAIRQFAKDMAK